MRSLSGRRVRFAWNVVPILALSLALAPRIAAQGGEPQYFAIRGATVVPVSGPRLENATVIIARGVIKSVAKEAPIPDEAWVIDGKGLTVAAANLARAGRSSRHNTLAHCRRRSEPRR